MDQAAIVKAIEESDLFDTSFYLQALGRYNIPLPPPGEAVRHYLGFGERKGLAPSLGFDPRFYAQQYPDLKGIEVPLIYHYLAGGRKEGRAPTLADLILMKGLGAKVQSLNCLPFVLTGQRDADQKNLQHLITIAHGFDPREVFSGELYLKLYPEVARAKMNPLYHYLASGAREGRKSSVELLRKIVIDKKAHQPGKPLLIIGTHELSRTGAPLVALNVARALAGRFNIVFMARRGGALEADIAGQFFATVVSEGVDMVLAFAMDLLKPYGTPLGAIFSSVECDRLIEAMADFDVPVLTLIHEYAEYTFPEYKKYVPLVHGEAAVYSSAHLKHSWRGHLADVCAAEDRIFVCPQPETGGGRTMDKASARQALGAALGLDMTGRRLVIAAGQVQMRKGTDLFLQIARKVTAGAPGQWLFVWIGDWPDETDMAYGVWLHAYIRKQLEGQADIRLLPPGPVYATLQAAADAFLLTSRLDPLPNVALDALAAGQALFYFDDASGVRELVESRGVAAGMSPYLDIFDMTGKLEAHFASQAFAPAAPRPAQGRNFDDYAGYAGWLVSILQETTARTRAAAPPPVDPAFVGELTTTAATLKVLDSLGPDATRIARTAERTLARGVAWIHPAPGRGGDGTAWPSLVIEDGAEHGEPLPGDRVFVHVRAGEADQFDEIVQKLVWLGMRDDILVTAKRDRHDDLLRSARGNGVTVRLIDAVPGDEDGFLAACAPLFAQHPRAVFGHMAGGVAGDSLLTRAALRPFRDAATGLVFAETPRVSGWGSSLDRVRRLAETHDDDRLRAGRPGPFPRQGELWVRGRVAGDMVGLVEAIAWPATVGGESDAHAHLVRRLWPWLCIKAGFNWTTVWRPPEAQSLMSKSGDHLSS